MHCGSSSAVRETTRTDAAEPLSVREVSHESCKGVQLRFPVKCIRPIAAQIFEELAFQAERRAGARDDLRPSGLSQAQMKVIHCSLTMWKEKGLHHIEMIYSHVPCVFVAVWCSNVIEFENVRMRVVSCLREELE